MALTKVTVSSTLRLMRILKIQRLIQGWLKILLTSKSNKYQGAWLRPGMGLWG